MSEQVYSIDVESFARGFGSKGRVEVKTVGIANVDLSADVTAINISGSTPDAGDRILLTGQSTTSENGVYVVESGAGNTYRAEDYLTGDNVANTFLSVTAGTYEKTEWHMIGSGETADVGSGTFNDFVMKNILNYDTGDIFYAQSDQVLAKLSKPSDVSFLEMNGSGVPQWVSKDDVTAGLDPKESVRFATLAPIIGTYAAGGGSGGTGNFTAVDLTDTGDFDLDGNTVAIGDRLLIKNQADPKQNGIYVVTTAGAAGVIERASDHDGSPTSEVSSGNHTFVELGATYANTGWVLQGNGTLALNTDNISWVQFNASITYTGGDGIDITGTNISADLKANGGLVIESNEIAVDLGASSITGTLAISDGGTGLTSITAGNLLIGNGTSAATLLAPLARKVLISNSSPAYELTNTINLSQINGASDDLALLKFSPAVSAVKEFTIANSAAGGNPTLSVTSGSQTNVSMLFQVKGTGTYDLLGTSTASAELKFYEDTDNGSNYTALKSAASIGSNVTYTLPAVDGSSGHIMQTNGSGVLSFINPDTTFKRDLSLATRSYHVTNNSYRTIIKFPWDVSRYGSGVTCGLIYETSVSSAQMSLRISKTTPTAVLATDTGIATSGIRTLAFTGPTVDCRLYIEVKRDTTSTPPFLIGISLTIN